MRALLSVSDKTGIIPFAKQLIALGFDIISTGGTLDALQKASVKATPITDVTGFPECLGGRVKTLHPSIHAGILAKRDNPEHMETLSALEILPFDLICVNLYPFAQTIQANHTFEDAVEQIDIGGPTLLRAAAKNYETVTVLTDPSDYAQIVSELQANGHISRETNLIMSAKVFALTAHYDAIIAAYLALRTNAPPLPHTLTLTYTKEQDMRYGENPHQSAAFYRESTPSGLVNAIKLHGKALSFNNITDTNAALALLREFADPTVVVCKHGTPCGVACDTTLVSAFERARDADPVSIFGGIIACNREVDANTADAISKLFIEVVIAPSYTPDALDRLTSKKNIRLLSLANLTETVSSHDLDIKKVFGGIVAQTHDTALVSDLQVVTNRAPSSQELSDLHFAWKLVKHTKSNAIVIAKNLQSIGIGAGQVSRIWATNQAIDHATEHFGAPLIQGAVLASDAFFPFSDCVSAAQLVGITAIIQPGGSVNDQASIDVCNEHGIAMIFTNMRHFRH